MENSCTAQTLLTAQTRLAILDDSKFGKLDGVADDMTYRFRAKRVCGYYQLRTRLHCNVRKNVKMKSAAHAQTAHRRQTDITARTLPNLYDLPRNRLCANAASERRKPVLAFSMKSVRTIGRRDMNNDSSKAILKIK